MTQALLDKLKSSFKVIKKRGKKQTVYTNGDGRIVNIITGKSKV